ncbi:MAG: amidohydrolase family protein, partial [Acidimicrobiales bacterium]|nr:amidohydrolase family protein [Acidimicrobiales bacterium]
MYDLVIRNGRIHDGTGAPPFDGDLAVVGGTIAAVGQLDETLVGPDTEVIDARGLMVTPGFIDAHTHYDGQITWDP